MDQNKTLKTFLLGLGVGVVMMVSVVSGAVAERLVGLKFLDKLFSQTNNTTLPVSQTVVDQESVVTQVVEKAGPSVVTVTISKTTVSAPDLFGFDVFGGFFGQRQQPEEQKIEQDIGTGFVISSDGLIVTNKHVVADTSAKYKVVLGKDEVLEVNNIYRDPVTDMAILKVDKTGLTPLPMGDSDKIRVGQTVIAIGTALGEFRSTVTTGVISGLGRGITAGSPFEGAEKLDNVIQTDAAINPGNSGGPLINSSGEVIGVNVAVSQGGQNIGFALPINIVKDSINNFKTTGEFERPFLGVSYRMISKKSALLNEVPMGAYVQEVVTNSPAEIVGIKQGDIITEIDGKKLDGEKDGELANLINNKKLGQSMKLKVWREGEDMDFEVKLDKKR